MSESMWDDGPEGSVSEYELLEEAQETEDLAQGYETQPVVEITDDELEQITDESAFDLNEQESTIVYNARLRLERAKLYEMLINHDLFEGVDANPQAIKTVQNELKHYIVGRLEILLGIREEIKKAKIENKEEGHDFNVVEKDFLKQLAYKGTLGRSITDKSEPKPLKPLSFTPNKLKPIAAKQELKPQPEQTPVKKSTKKQVKHNTPVRKKENKTPKKTAIKGGTLGPRAMTQAEIEQLAKEDIEKMNGRKPFHKMNAKEKAAEVARVNERYTKAKSGNAAPMPDFNQLYAKYTMEQQTRQSDPKNQRNQLNTLLANMAVTQKNNQGE